MKPYIIALICLGVGYYLGFHANFDNYRVWIWQDSDSEIKVIQNGRAVRDIQCENNKIDYTYLFPTQ